MWVNFSRRVTWAALRSCQCTGSLVEAHVECWKLIKFCLCIQNERSYCLRMQPHLQYYWKHQTCNISLLFSAIHWKFYICIHYLCVGVWYLERNVDNDHAHQKRLFENFKRKRTKSRNFCYSFWSLPHFVNRQFTTTSLIGCCNYRSMTLNLFRNDNGKP